MRAGIGAAIIWKTRDLNGLLLWKELGKPFPNGKSRGLDVVGPAGQYSPASYPGAIRDEAVVVAPESGPSQSTDGV